MEINRQPHVLPHGTLPPRAVTSAFSPWVLRMCADYSVCYHNCITGANTEGPVTSDGAKIDAKPLTAKRSYLAYKEQKTMQYGETEGDFGFEVGKEVAAQAEKLILQGRIGQEDALEGCEA